MKRKVKLLAFEFTVAHVEQIGILIRDEARLSRRSLQFQRSSRSNHILDLRLYQLTGLERERSRASTTSYSRRSRT